MSNIDTKTVGSFGSGSPLDALLAQFKKIQQQIEDEEV
jgi:hypothetical protein